MQITNAGRVAQCCASCTDFKNAAAHSGDDGASTTFSRSASESSFLASRNHNECRSRYNISSPCIAEQNARNACLHAAAKGERVSFVLDEFCGFRRLPSRRSARGPRVALEQRRRVCGSACAGGRRLVVCRFQPAAEIRSPESTQPRSRGKPTSQRFLSVDT